MNRHAVHPAFAVAIRAAAATFTAGAVLFLLSRAVIPEGRLSTVTDFSGPAPFLSEPKPSARLAEADMDANGMITRAVAKSPLYVDIRPPAAFDTIAVELRYEASGRPAVEIGALASSLDDRFDVRPAEHAGIDALQWSRVSSGKLTLLQRDGRYASVDEFFHNPPRVSEVATYLADARLPYRLEGYVPSGTARTFRPSIRGSARILAYAKDEPLSFSFALQDMNRMAGEDPAYVSVTRIGGDGKVLATAVLKDDGNTEANQKSVGLRTLSISLADPAEGAYRIILSTTSDVFIREIGTRQSKLVFEGTAYLGDHVGYSDQTQPVTLWTDARRLVMRTSHVEGLQTITAGGTQVIIDEPHLRYVTRLPGQPLVAVRSPRRDVLFEADGTFAFSQSEWFDPLPFMLGPDTIPSDLEGRGIGYLLTSYEPPTFDGNDHLATAVFDTSALDKTADGDYRMAIIVPGVEDGQSEIRLRSATVTMRRTPLGWLDGIRRVFALFSEPQDDGAPKVFTEGASFGESPQ